MRERKGYLKAVKTIPSGREEKLERGVCTSNGPWNVPFFSLPETSQPSLSLGRHAPWPADAPPLGGLRRGRPELALLLPPAAVSVVKNLLLSSGLSDGDAYQFSASYSSPTFQARIRTPLLPVLRLLGLGTWNQGDPPVAPATARSCLARASGESADFRCPSAARPSPCSFILCLVVHNDDMPFFLYSSLPHTMAVILDLLLSLTPVFTPSQLTLSSLPYFY